MPKTCTNCGTEIAEKALICYRCGQATFTAKRAPAAPPAKGRQIILVVAMVVLILGALFMGQVQTGTVPEWVRYTVMVLALVVLASRVFARRRRRGGRIGR
jgi:protein-S-isoprenylcysteine O-methyltransferase Ste14